MTTREDIRRWLAEAKERGATHMLVACDTFDWEDYPVFVLPGQDARSVADQHSGPNMTKLMEVYNLSMDLDAQLVERCAMHFDATSEVPRPARREKTLSPRTEDTSPNIIPVTTVKGETR